LNAGGDKPLNAAACLKRYLPMVGRVTDALVTMFTSEKSRSWARLILREQQDPSEAFEAHYDSSIGGLLSIFTELIARTQNRTADDRQVRLLVLTIIGQALILRAAFASVLKHLDCHQIGSKDVVAIQALIRRNVAAMLSAESHREQGGQSRRSPRTTPGRRSERRLRARAERVS
jgi:hypothetical protein